MISWSETHACFGACNYYRPLQTVKSNFIVCGVRSLGQIQNSLMLYAPCFMCHIVFKLQHLFIKIILFTDDTRWTTVIKSNSGQLDEFSVSYQSLLPSTSYLFRIVAYNDHGISYPAYSDDVVCTQNIHV